MNIVLVLLLIEVTNAINSENRCLYLPLAKSYGEFG